MAKNSNILLGAIVVVFLIVFAYQANNVNFSIYASTDTCNDWILEEQLEGDVEQSTISTPFCWKTDAGDLTVTELKETEFGCQVIYSEGCTNQQLTSEDCTFSYWYDSDSSACNYKQFCGFYMYEGLRTFDSIETCELEFSEIKSPWYSNLGLWFIIILVAFLVTLVLIKK